MPNNKNRDGSVYVPTGNPDTVNYTPNYAPGELGTDYDFGQRHYQIVQLDSGATAATPAGVVAANQAAYWKDKSSYLVTNDSRFAIGGVVTNSYQNQGAGVFRNAGTAGNIVHIIQRGQNIPCLDGGNTFAVGESVILEGSTTDKAFDRVAVGTAPTFRVMGYARGAAANGVVNVDLDIPSIP